MRGIFLWVCISLFFGAGLTSTVVKAIRGQICKYKYHFHLSSLLTLLGSATWIISFCDTRLSIGIHGKRCLKFFRLAFPGLNTSPSLGLGTGNYGFGMHGLRFEINNCKIWRGLKQRWLFVAFTQNLENHKEIARWYNVWTFLNMKI